MVQEKYITAVRIFQEQMRILPEFLFFVRCFHSVHKIFSIFVKILLQNSKIYVIISNANNDNV